MIQSFDRACIAARQRASMQNRVQFVIHVPPGDIDDAGGYAVGDLETIEDIYHADDDDILFATYGDD